MKDLFYLLQLHIQAAAETKHIQSTLTNNTDGHLCVPFNGLFPGLLPTHSEAEPMKTRGTGFSNHPTISVKALRGNSRH